MGPHRLPLRRTNLRSCSSPHLLQHPMGAPHGGGGGGGGGGRGSVLAGGSEHGVTSSSAFRPMPIRMVAGRQRSCLSIQSDISGDLPVPSLGSSFEARRGLWQVPCKDGSSSPTTINGSSSPSMTRLRVQSSQGSFSLSPGDQGSFSVSPDVQSLPPSLHVQRSQGSISLSPSCRGKRPGSASWGMQAGGASEAQGGLSRSTLIQVQVRPGPTDTLATATASVASTVMDPTLCSSTPGSMVHGPHAEGLSLHGLLHGLQPATMNMPPSTDPWTTDAGAGSSETRRLRSAEGVEPHSLPGSSLILNPPGCVCSSGSSWVCMQLWI